MPPPSADPIFECVDMQRAIGYEYKEDNGQVYGPFPALAIFTWSLKGMFPPSKMIRLAGRREFHPLSEYANDILILARIQLTNVLLKQRDWFYIDKSSEVQGPFPAESMLGFIQARFFDESAQFYGRPVGQMDRPRPSSNSSEFRKYGDLLNETLAQYRLELKQWREEAYGRDVEAAMNGDVGTVQMNGSPERQSLPVAMGPSSVDPVALGPPGTEAVAMGPPLAPTLTQGMTTTALPILSPVPPQPVNPVPEAVSLPISGPIQAELSFERLKEEYAGHFCADRGVHWWFLINEGHHGPYEDLTPHYSALQADSLICWVTHGAARPLRQNFFSFETLLKTIHNNQK